MQNIDLTKFSNLKELLNFLDKEVEANLRWFYIEKFLKLTASKNKKPFTGLFEITPNCNLDCKMCYVHLSNNISNYLPLEFWTKVAESAINEGTFNFILTGGECLTYPYFKDLYIFLENKGCHIFILTNGILLNDSMIDFFVNHPPMSIQISIYGSSEINYFKVTGHKCFTKVIDNIKKAKKAHLPIKIAITPSKFMEDAKEIIELVNSLDLPYGINKYIAPPRSGTGREQNDIEMNINSYVNLLFENEKIKNKNFKPFCNGIIPNAGSESKEIKVGVPCNAGRNLFSVTWDGLMYPCLDFRNICIDLKSNSFKKCWDYINKKANEFIMPIECNECAYKEYCQICPAEHLYGAEEGHCNQNVCEITKRKAEVGLFNIKNKGE